MGKSYKPEKLSEFLHLNLKTIPDRLAQQTENMMLVDPVYMEINPRDTLDMITAATGLPITITSKGPKPEDKIFL